MFKFIFWEFMYLLLIYSVQNQIYILTIYVHHVVNLRYLH